MSKPVLMLAAAPPAIGPAMITLLGYDLPVLSAILGIVGVVLALALAPPPKRRLTGPQLWALRIVLMLLTLALIIYDQAHPLMSLAWAIGLGFSGYTVVELLGSLVPRKIRAVLGIEEPPPPPEPTPLPETAPPPGDPR